MNKPFHALILAMAALSACSSNSTLYHDQPLVAKVTNGMSRDQVMQVGGKPDAETERTVVPGTCFDYMLTKADNRQPYSVSFDGTGKVDNTAFMTCAEWNNAQRRARLPSMGGSSGSGY
ncbi:MULTISPECIES: osmotically-inducible lipoprotein OsmE [Pseudomonas]|jgi:osmotically inducible lipoprotein OsmE|uniref:osmotically-inducible lipoprotein OsmE n=1 Tax=Pseudomonas TaxID=286 RepID=UPI00049A8651|nr:MULTISPECIES: osmotically-inducible lipoprotein OsmE [Pseudomonas]AHZ77368.1 membrane protein SmpA [Pseudomonas putida]MBO2892727.1 osmotically-inducible lipoprotein OsmE [Pseudomonas asiatica]MCK2118999.1 osmotically-inducible lipoprotein OsmE [Pseudomonas sp. PNPG3]QUN70292.1 osmotically-inducible lipoprotein OsmE [Pseudomonas sp. JS425]